MADEVTENRLAQLIMTGGEYRSWAHALMGPTTVQNIESMHADYCFLSTSGISSMACFHPYQEVAEVKAAMLRSSEVRVLLIDNSKFGRRALFKFAELGDFDHVVVDAEAPEEELGRLEAAGVHVVVELDGPQGVVFVGLDGLGDVEDGRAVGLVSDELAEDRGEDAAAAGLRGLAGQQSVLRLGAVEDDGVVGGGGGSAATGAGGQRERSRRGNGEPCLLQVHGYYLLVDGRDRWAVPVVMSSRVAGRAWK